VPADKIQLSRKGIGARDRGSLHHVDKVLVLGAEFRLRGEEILQASDHLEVRGGSPQVRIVEQFAEKRENLNSTPLIAAFRAKGWTSATVPFTAENGRPAIGHARSSAVSGWVLALQQEESEIFEAMEVIQRFALALLGATVLLVIAIAWFSARSLVSPLMKLTTAAERMSLGDLKVKIDVDSRDEIGLLAQAIGRMQTSLQIAMRRLRKKR
jgi:HAMP domain-containing protein